MLLKFTRICFGAARRLQSTEIVNHFKFDRLTGDDAGIVLFRMNRSETRNAISRQMLEEFCDAIEQVKFDRTARVIVLGSDVKGAFCAGADLKERVKMAQEDVPRFVNKARGMISELEKLPQPVIAAIDGFALGGGLEMALACDMRIAADSAKMGLTETRLAIIPGAGGTQRLPRTVGVALAKELIFTGRMISGSEARDIGLVNHVTVQNENGDAAFQRSLKLAREILPQGPIALKVAKHAIFKGMDMDLQSGLALEELCYAQVIPTKDRIEGLKAFKEKRPPVYTGQ